MAAKGCPKCRQARAIVEGRATRTRDSMTLAEALKHLKHCPCSRKRAGGAVKPGRK